MKDERQSTQPDASGIGGAAENLRAALGLRLRKARTAAGLSQQAVADAMNERGFNWRQTTVAKTEASDRPTLFTEVVALSDILGRDVKYFLTDRIELDDLADELALQTEAAQGHTRAAESALQSAKMDEKLALLREGIALAIIGYTRNGDTGVLRATVDLMASMSVFALDACMKVLNVAGIPRKLVTEIDRIAMWEAAVNIESTGRATGDRLLASFGQDEVVREAQKFITNNNPNPLFLRFLRDEKIYREYAGQLLVDLVAENVELRDA